ncbi:MAG: hypothetical protein LQ338_006137 [Usnochroma carphineum]|nr:MAG: hypothetical protein LQ338_006137 [Usnochroma carphineum]
MEANDEAARRAGLRSSPRRNRFIPIESQPNAASAAQLAYMQSVPTSAPEIDFANFQHPRWDPSFMNGNYTAAPDLIDAYSATAPVAPSGLNGQSQRMLPASQMGFGQMLQSSNPWASAYSSSQVPEHTQLGFHPTNGLLPIAQNGCCSSKVPPESRFQEPNPLAMEDLALSSRTPASSSHSRDQSQESKLNGATLKGKEPEGAMMDHGHLVDNMPRTTVFSMPSNYATAENPMTSGQRAQLQHNAQLYAHQVPHYAPYGITGSAAPSAEHINTQDFMHQCSCGPDCQCFLCVVHPFNPVSNDHIGEMADLMTSESVNDEARSRPQSWYGEPSPNPVSGPEVDAGNWDSMLSTAEGAGTSQMMMNGYPAAATNAYGGNGLPAAAAAAPYQIHSNDYITMEYRFPAPGSNMCSNGNSTCRCGDNCNCEGCFTHTGHHY